MRVMLFGDGEWAERSFQRLLSEGFDVPAVVIRHTPSSPHLAAAARSAGVEILQPDKANTESFLAEVARVAPDVNLSIAYDQIIRRPLLEAAPLGFVNIHGGMLPYYRGRNIVNWAIINNETELGVTAHFMDDGIDTGPILLQHKLRIAWEDDYGTMLAKIVDVMPELVTQALGKLDQPETTTTSQDGLPGTYVGGRRDGDEWLDWNESSLNLYNKIRAITHPGPGARTLLGNQMVVVWRARWDSAWPQYVSTPGEIVGREKDRGVYVKTGDSTLFLETVQMPAADETVPTWPVGTRLGLNTLDLLHRLQLSGAPDGP